MKSYYYERLWGNTRNCKAGISAEAIPQTINNVNPR